MATALVGCDSSKSRRSGGEGGHAGSVASQTNDGGLLGSGGSSGTTGLSAGGTSSGSTGMGGQTGFAAGGASTGASGGGGARSLDAAVPDAGCVGTACTQDAGSNPDLPPTCSSIRTQAECDLRSDCHSVNTGDEPSCACPTPGCCSRFLRCDQGGSVACGGGLINCTQTTPSCVAPYAVHYRDEFKCYDGCVLASKCSPTATCPAAAPSNGATCGNNPLSCIYQDCAGAGRTEALCQGGTWSVRTVTCDSVACKGGGIPSGAADVICGPGQICVHTTENGGAYRITPSCATNNCGSSPLSLSCIQGLSGSCGVAADSTITCSLVNCTGPGGCPP